VRDLRRSHVEGSTANRRLAISESISSDYNGLRRHVKQYSFACNFKWLSYKQSPVPARVATLSQHLFYEPQPRFGAASWQLRVDFARSRKPVAGALIPQRRRSRQVLRRLRSSAGMRKHRSFAEGSANGSDQLRGGRRTINDNPRRLTAPEVIDQDGLMPFRFLRRLLYTLRQTCRSRLQY
jgi:hypothetical protein